MGQRASAPAAGGLRASGSLPGTAVRGGSHDGELPSRRMVGAGRAGQGSPGTPEHIARQGWHPDPAEDPRGGCGARGSLLAHVSPTGFAISGLASPVTPGVVGALGQQGLELGLDSGSWALCCRQLLQGIYFWPPGTGEGMRWEAGSGTRRS